MLPIFVNVELSLFRVDILKLRRFVNHLCENRRFEKTKIMVVADNCLKFAVYARSIINQTELFCYNEDNNKCYTFSVFHVLISVFVTNSDIALYSI